MLSLEQLDMLSDALTHFERTLDVDEPTDWSASDLLGMAEELADRLHEKGYRLYWLTERNVPDLNRFIRGKDLITLMRPLGRDTDLADYL